jgi:hypothetical protein
VKFWRSFFFGDLARKFLALGIAALIWWRVDAALERDQVWPFTIVTGSGTPNDHEILVNVPDGWLLQNPKPGASIDISFKGNDRTFEDFTSALCAATAVVNIDENSKQTNLGFTLKVEELDWLRKGMAINLLKGTDKNKDLAFEFVRHDSVDTLLDPTMLNVEGDPADGFQQKAELATFSPNKVRIHGPFGVAEVSLIRQQDGDLFESIELTQENQKDLIQELKLSRAALDEGMWMEPESFTVTLPIRRSDSESIEWRPNQPLTLGQAPDGLAWTVRPWSNEMWLASYEPVEGLILGTGPDWVPTSDWLVENIDLVVHLDQIPEGATEGHELYVDWIISDPSLMQNRVDLQKLKNALTIWPSRVDEQSARTVEMSKPEGP